VEARHLMRGAIRRNQDVLKTQSGRLGGSSAPRAARPARPRSTRGTRRLA
jgi:hypothetical protein